VPSLIISKSNVADIKARLGAMQATGTTDMGNGLAVGLQQVESNYRQDGLNRVVLLGDGESPHLEKWARALAPRARVAGGHGQMPAAALEDLRARRVI